MARFKRRMDIVREQAAKRNRQIIADYYRRDENGGWKYTVAQLAEKHGVSRQMVYWVLRKYGEKRD